jgi:hypothetical protein
MPYYKLKVFKGKSDQYSLYKDEYVMKLKVKNLNDHDFFKKMSKFRISS